MKEADEKLTSEKSQTAVVLDATGVTLVNVAPPEVYAVPDVFVISSEVENAVVDAPNVASLSYKAILKVLPVVAVKLCVPFKSSTLKLVQIADVIAIFYLLWGC